VFRWLEAEKEPVRVGDGHAAVIGTKLARSTIQREIKDGKGQGLGRSESQKTCLNALHNSLRWRTVKGEVEKNPVFHSKAGFFIGIQIMMGNSPLKVAASISLGIHLLFLGIASAYSKNRRSFETPRLM